MLPQLQLLHFFNLDAGTAAVQPWTPAGSAAHAATPAGGVTDGAVWAACAAAAGPPRNLLLSGAPDGVCQHMSAPSQQLAGQPPACCLSHHVHALVISKKEEPQWSSRLQQVP